jgi:hypothetical protein
MLSRIPYIEDADGAHKIEFRPANIDVGAVLYEMEGVVSPHEVAPDSVGAPEAERAACCGGLIKERG